MPSTEKLDLFKTHKDQYAAPKKPIIVTLPKVSYIAIEDTGAPGGEEFQSAVASLYAMAYTMKFAAKDRGNDYSVCKLEGLWWHDGDKPFNEAAPEEIHWQLLIRQPAYITKADVKQAREALAKRGKKMRSAEIDLVALKEGKCVQMLHIGPYDQEGRSIDIMRAFAEEQGYSQFGTHHDIYISDPRRLAPERLKTILRIPVRK